MSGGYRGGTQAEWAFKSRTHRAELVSVNEELGTATVRVEGMHAQHENVRLPMAVTVRGFASSWMRYMPDDGDFCEVAYNARNEPRIVVLVPAGYAETAELGKRKAADGGLPAWTTLRKGEFDARSRGGAGLKGTREGRLELFAGATVVALDKTRREVTVGGTDRVAYESGGAELVVGQVFRRPLPTSLLPVDVTASAAPGVPLFPPSTALVKKEWRVRLGTNNDPTGVATFGTPLLYPGIYEELAGDIRADGVGGAPVFGSYGVPLRYRKRVLAATPDPAAPTALDDLFRVEVDQLGNTKITIIGTAVPGGVTLEGRGPSPGTPSVVPLAVTFGGVALTAASLPMLLEAALGTATLKGALGTILESAAPLGVKLGGVAAAEPVPLGTQLVVLLNTIADLIGAIPGGATTPGGAIAGPAIKAAIATAAPALLSQKVAVL